MFGVALKENYKYIMNLSGSNSRIKLMGWNSILIVMNLQWDYNYYEP